MPIKSRMNSIMGQIESEHPELFALEFGITAESDFVYTSRCNMGGLAHYTMLSKCARIPILFGGKKNKKGS